MKYSREDKEAIAEEIIFQTLEIECMDPFDIECIVEEEILHHCDGNHMLFNTQDVINTTQYICDEIGIEY